MTKYALEDMYNVKQALSPVSADATAHEVVGATIDLSGYNSAMIVLVMGGIATGGGVTYKLYEDDASNMATESECTVANHGILESPTAITDKDDNKAYKISYVGNKRYIRLKITTTGSVAIAYGAVAILGHKRNNTSLPPTPA